MNKEVKILSIKNSKSKRYYLYLIIKRIIDICFGIAGVIIMIPICIILFIIYKIKKIDCNLFFTQERIGKHGKLFKMYKFQSMVNNADDILLEILKNDKKAAAEYKKYKKFKNDPRITGIGSFLRKTSLDEVPQFINILKGDMSMVGPRPYLNREKKDMKKSYETIIKLKPGLTGLWQTSGRSEVTFSERMKLDHKYYENHNFKEDIVIIFKTIEKVFKNDGAK